MPDLDYNKIAQSAWAIFPDGYERLNTPPAKPGETPGATPELNRILASVGRLRPLPGNVTRLLRAIDDPATTAGMVADYLLLDQALTAYILRVANSAQLGYSKPCASPKDAVMRLGFKQVKALVLSTVAAGPLTRRLTGYRLGSGELWQHSISTATRARWLAQAVSFNAPEEAYVAGLLHDMGKLLMDQFILSDYPRILEMMEAKKLFFWQVEGRLFGIDHAGVGGLMAERWSFPPNLQEAIRCHHAPGQSQAQQKLAALVNVADTFSNLETSPQSRPGKNREIHPDSLPILNLDERSLARMYEIMNKALAEMGNVYLAPDVQDDTL